MHFYHILQVFGLPRSAFLDRIHSGLLIWRTGYFSYGLVYCEHESIDYLLLFCGSCLREHSALVTCWIRILSWVQPGYNGAVICILRSRVLSDCHFDDGLWDAFRHNFLADDHRNCREHDCILALLSLIWVILRDRIRLDFRDWLTVVVDGYGNWPTKVDDRFGTRTSKWTLHYLSSSIPISSN